MANIFIISGIKKHKSSSRNYTYKFITSLDGNTIVNFITNVKHWNYLNITNVNSFGGDSNEWVSDKTFNLSMFDDLRILSLTNK